MSAPGTIEREILWTGIGGQGVQLAAKILAQAATLEGHEVMSLGTYGGTMRGGNTDATIVLANGRITQPPMVSSAWAAVVAHPRFFEPMRSKVRADGVVLADADLLVEEPLGEVTATLHAIPATTIAREVDAPKSAALVLLGALARATGVVTLESLEAGLETSLPPYRRETLEMNQRALRAGGEALAAGLHPAWRKEAA